MSSRSSGGQSGRTYKSVSKQLVDQVVRRHAPRDYTRIDYWRLIDALRRESVLLRAAAIRPSGPDVAKVAKACARLAQFSRWWVHVPESWFPERHSSRHQAWCDFVGHLLDRYSTPQCFATLWLSANPSPWELDLHYHLGQGKSIRSFALPYGMKRLSKSEARYFMQAPSDMGVDGAIRWAQIRAKGGDKRLARFLGSRLAVSGADGWEEFVAGAILFFTRAFRKSDTWSIDEHELQRFLVFAYEQRYEPSRKTVGPWMNDEPVDKQFTLADWTVRRLRRHMIDWRDAYPTQVQNIACWLPSRYRAFEATTSGSVYRIAELCTNRDLKNEGVSMRHCVLTYTSNCLAGRSSIWSLRRVSQGNHMRRLATIEVNPQRNAIIQVKAKANKPPNSQSIELICQWAEREGLSFALDT